MRTVALFFAIQLAAGAQTLINGGRTIQGTINYCADSGTSDAYSCSLSPAISAYSTGAVYYVRANTANTGAATLSLNGLAQAVIKKNSSQDLNDNDIKAGQIVAFTYDGTNMQMLSQPGTGGASGPALTITTPGLGYWSPFGEGGGQFPVINAVDRDVRLWQVMLPYRSTFSKVTVNVAVASGTVCPGGTCGMVVGLYDSSCTTLLTAGRAVSGGSPNINAVGPAAINLFSTVNLDPGVYYLAVSTDSGPLALFGKDIHYGFSAIANHGTPRFGGATNKSTGNGGTLTLPAACGPVLTSGEAPPAMSLWER